MNYWLVKSEPESYSWAQFVKDGRTAWTGVRNFQARIHLRAMKAGDRVFFYHSNEGKNVVGLAKVVKVAYPDPTAAEGDWVCVDLTPVKPLAKPVGLDLIKPDPLLQEMVLVKNSRLSVQPVTEKQFNRVLELAATKANNDFRAVIFDMDGVIVDSEPRHERAFLEVANAIGYGATHGVNWPDYLGRSDRELWVDFVARHKPPQPLEQLLKLKRDRVLEILQQDQPVYAGLTELVEKLARKCRLGLASGSERAVVEAVLSLKDLGRHFSATVSVSEVKRGKPDPEIFLCAADLLDVAPVDCWVIEHSKPGVAAALAAGMRVIAITNTHPAIELRPATVVVENYAEIERLLLGS